jgi:hypothetical protein
VFKYTIILANLNFEWLQEARYLPTNTVKFFPCSVTSDLNEVSKFFALNISILIVLEASVIYC